MKISHQIPHAITSEIFALLRKGREGPDRNALDPGPQAPPSVHNA